MKSEEIYLKIVRLGIGKEDNPYFLREIKPERVDWNAFADFAELQGVTAVVMDGLDRLTVNGSRFTEDMPVALRLEWIGNVLQNYEQRYETYKKALSSLTAWYRVHGYKMMLLKGYVCGLDWPKSEHRPYGDIDIWLFGHQREADAALSSWFKVQGLSNAIDNLHHHHTAFEWDGFWVENHYDFVNTKDLKSSQSIEKIFKELGMDDSYSIDVNGEKVYVPSPNLHALFLMRHLALHFSSVSINLRQLIDWAFFVEKHNKEINWSWLNAMLEKFHMSDFYNCINAICVGDLGFSVRIFPNVQFDATLKDKVLNDILTPQYVAEEPKGFIKRMVYKYERWQGNAWKQNLCFGENRLAMFWRSLWAHLIKPSTL